MRLTYWSYPWVDGYKEMVRNKETLIVTLLLMLCMMYCLNSSVHTTGISKHRFFFLSHWVVYVPKPYHSHKFLILSGVSLTFLLTSGAVQWVYTLRGTYCVQWATRVQIPGGPSLLTQAMTLNMSSPCDCLGPSIRQKYRSRLPFPPPGDCPDPGIKPQSPVSPASHTGFLPTESPGKSLFCKC